MTNQGTYNMDNTAATEANTYTLQSEIYQEMNDDMGRHCSVRDHTLVIKSELLFIIHSNISKQSSTIHNLLF